MKKIDYLSTLFVGIDVSSKTNTVCAIDFNCNQLLACAVTNNQPGADELVGALLKILSSGKFKMVVIALESTSFYSTHIATYLSDNPQLKLCGAFVYCLNPKMIANYRKSFIGLGQCCQVNKKSAKINPKWLDKNGEKYRNNK